MDEVYTCVCKCQSFEIHDGFIKCCYCSMEYKFKRIMNLAGKERIDLECVSDFNKRVEQVKKDIADDSKTNGGG